MARPIVALLRGSWAEKASVLFCMFLDWGKEMYNSSHSCSQGELEVPAEAGVSLPRE
jgi:hypothetical protein